MRMKSKCASCIHPYEWNYGEIGSVKIRNNICGVTGEPITPELPLILKCVHYKRKEKLNDDENK